MEKVLSAVKVGPSRTEIREFPMPEIPDDGALMKVEVAQPEAAAQSFTLAWSTGGASKARGGWMRKSWRG